MISSIELTHIRHVNEYHYSFAIYIYIPYSRYIMRKGKVILHLYFNLPQVVKMHTQDAY